MPRLSLRKGFMYLVAAVSCLLLLINLHQRTMRPLSFMAGGSGGNPGGGPVSHSGEGPGVYPGGGPGGHYGGGPGGHHGGNMGEGVHGSQENLSRKLAEKEMKESLSLEESPPIITKIFNTTLYRPVSPKLLFYPPRDLNLNPLDPGNLEIPPSKDRPWYMKEGELRPQPVKIDPNTGQRDATVFPEERVGQDRISDQLMFVPPQGSVPDNQDDPNAPLKKILLWNGASSWGGFRPGRGVFLKERCPVSTCVISSNRAEGVGDAELILFKDHFTMPNFARPPTQLWMIYLLECPMHTQLFKHKGVFNWTSTYRTDSTVVAPYERWQYYNENIKGKNLERNYAANKTKQVAWFVSNCGARNGRLPFARELGKYINVDIYGACGTKRCPRSSADKCFDMLNRDYKFYLAFENSNCKDYITEKFFVNGLGNDILPIAMGARPQDYLRASPEKSFIHVDDFAGPKELAEYLHKLDKDDSLYNEYFKWKATGEFVNTKFFCRVCALLHDPKVRTVENSYYSDINAWWRGDGTCINGSWKRHKKVAETSKNKKVSQYGKSDNSSIEIP